MPIRSDATADSFDESVWPALPDDWDLWLEAVVASPPPLLESEPEALTPDRAIDYLVELQREQARLAALESRAMVVAAGRSVQSRDVLVLDRASDRERQLTLTDEARDEIAAALHRSPNAVHDQIVTARLLEGALPGTRAALRDGRISPAHARAIADEVRRLDGIEDGLCPDLLAACADVEREVLPSAEVSTPGRTRRLAHRAVLKVDAAGHERRRQRARATIDVSLYAEGDGLAVLFARLPLLDAVRLHAGLDARARAASADCDASLGELRAQALVDAVCGADDAAASHTSHSPVTEISVVIDAGALLGVNELPADVSGALGGPVSVSAQAVRDLLADPDVPVSLRRLVSDPITGALLDRGRSSYAVTGRLRAYLATRDRTCRHPGCTRPAARCQVDHAQEWDDGGRSDRANIGLLCTRHHQLKTHGRWEITESAADGSCTWRSPAGRTYTVDPPPLV